MSKIDDLITKYCPDGVEWKDLGECGKIIRGKRVTKSQLNDDKKYPVISGGFKPLGYFDDYNREANTITIAQYGSAGYLDWQKGRFWANDVCYSVYPNEGLNNRFLYFILSSKQDLIYSLKTNAIPAHLPQNLLEKITIPIPPLPVQEEIVSILDKFTALEAELEAELEARTRQYEYYRNELLSFDGKDVEWKKLKDVLELKRGTRVVKSQLETNGNIPVYQNSLKPLGYFNKSNSLAKSTFIICAGAAGDLGFSETPFWAADDCFVFNQNNLIQSRFLYYFLNTKQDFLYSRVRRASIPRLSRESIENIKIPIPPIEEQELIVAILDKFDALVNDISTGLPAEIQARRQQYEYYRGKLLTFEPLTA